MIAGLITAATASVIAWAMSRQAQAVRTYNAIEAGQLALQGIGRLIRNAGLGDGPALLEVAGDRLTLCGVGWREGVFRGQLLVDSQGHLVWTPVSLPPQRLSQCPGQDLPEAVRLVPGAAFEQVSFSTTPWDAASSPGRCGMGGPFPGCDGVAGLFVRVEPAGAADEGHPVAEGYVALRNTGAP